MSEEELKNAEPVPYFIHEGMMQRMSENNKRLLIALIVSLAAIPVVVTDVWKMIGEEILIRCTKIKGRCKNRP